MRFNDNNDNLSSSPTYTRTMSSIERKGERKRDFHLKCRF